MNPGFLQRILGAILLFEIVLVSFFLHGCTTVKGVFPDGTVITASSFLSNKRFTGSLKGANGELVIQEFEEDQTSGAAQIVGAAVKAAVGAVAP